MKPLDTTTSFSRLYDDLRVVLAVRRCGSMTNAATELGTTTSTISRQISRLRAQLGLYPFVKTDGDWRLNPALADLIDAFEQADGILETELGRLHRYSPTLTRDLKIGAPPTVLSHVLIPALTDLAKAAPRIRPVPENRVHENGLGSNDLAIVFQPPTSGHLRIRRCAKLSFALFAPRDWRPCDGWVRLTDKYSGPYMDTRRRYFGSEPCLKVDSFTQALQAMTRLGKAGALPVVVAADVPELYRLDTPELDVSRDLYALHHESRSNDPDIRATLDWIVRSLKAAEASALRLQIAQDRLCVVRR